MKQDKVVLRCEDGAEALVFTKYHFYNSDVTDVTNDFNYEMSIEDDYIGGDYKGFFGRLKRAWKAFTDKPVIYTGIYCEDKNKIRSFLYDCIALIEEN